MNPKGPSWVEPKSPAFKLRDETVNVLLNKGIPVVPYVSPVMPWISDIKDVFLKFKKAVTVEFECFNFRLNNIQEIINNIAMVDSTLKEKYAMMLNDHLFYRQTWQDMEEEIKKQAKDAKKRYNIYIHSFGDYFQNKYSGSIIRDGS